VRVLLLNPPSERVVIRDYLCSKTTKSNYLFHPIDLVVLSGLLAERYELSVLDAIAERLDTNAAQQRIAAFAPDVVISLVGSVSWAEDRRFLADVAARGARVLALGDVLHEEPEARLAEEPWLEAALHRFASHDALRYLEGEREALEDVTLRNAEGPVRVRARALGGTYRVPRPRHELFPAHGYRFSFARRTPFATVLTDYGCPYPCTFCVIGTLPYRTRPVEDVLLEVDHLRARGVHELFVMDQTFGVSERRGVQLADAFAQRGDLSWTTFTRPDHTGDELLAAMRRGGCHTLILGIESGDDAVLAATRKGYTLRDVERGVARAKALGLRVVGTFVIGLPGETSGSLDRTLQRALELDLDFLSLNVAVPRFGTEFRREVLGAGLARADDLQMDQSGSAAFLPTTTLSRAEVEAAKRRLNRGFYLRPRYLWKRVRDVRSMGELVRQTREGLALLRRNTP
jgi:anaerobic magnesium-protoporphyrin IX monomethyl ester cyclase